MWLISGEETPSEESFLNPELKVFDSPTESSVLSGIIWLSVLKREDGSFLIARGFLTVLLKKELFAIAYIPAISSFLRLLSSSFFYVLSLSMSIALSSSIF